MIGRISVETVTLLRHFRAGFVGAHKNAAGFRGDTPIVRMTGRATDKDLAQEEYICESLG
jgi:hypothetical protein